MTNKELIIIDGVDVSGCQYCMDNFCMAKKYVYHEVEAKCQDNPNCYYKQLKRLEKECGELKETANKGLDKCKDLIAKNILLKQQLALKEKECEELKKQLTALDGESITVEITQEEFERYKKQGKQLEAAIKYHNTIINTDTDECGCSCFSRQALQEIEEMGKE